jgi:hypothetical protein
MKRFITSLLILIVTAVNINTAKAESIVHSPLGRGFMLTCALLLVGTKEVNNFNFSETSKRAPRDRGYATRVRNYHNRHALALIIAKALRKRLYPETTAFGMHSEINICYDCDWKGAETISKNMTSDEITKHLIISQESEDAFSGLIVLPGFIGNFSARRLELGQYEFLVHSAITRQLLFAVVLRYH